MVKKNVSFYVFVHRYIVMMWRKDISLKQWKAIGFHQEVDETGHFSSDLSSRERSPQMLVK